MTTDHKPVRRRGRPTQQPLKAAIRSRCTLSQLDKYIALGGSEWLRKQIDAAPEPQKGGKIE